MNGPNHLKWVSPALAVRAFLPIIPARRFVVVDPAESILIAF
jgi:hypothetical protein